MNECGKSALQRSQSVEPTKNFNSLIYPMKKMVKLIQPNRLNLLFRKIQTGPDYQPLLDILHDFHAPIRFALAYGSGVYKQHGYSNVQKQQEPMVDFIFGVTHPEHWHALNIRQNRHHYSSLANFGSGTVATIQESFGAGLYYNPDVTIQGRRVKYGVVGIEDLLKDLTDWNTLYIAGRMQKPVMLISFKFTRYYNPI